MAKKITKSEVLQIRLTRAEKLAIRRVAKATGQTVTAAIVGAVERDAWEHGGAWAWEGRRPPVPTVADRGISTGSSQLHIKRVA